MFIIDKYYKKSMGFWYNESQMLTFVSYVYNRQSITESDTKSGTRISRETPANGKKISFLVHL